MGNCCFLMADVSGAIPLAPLSLLEAKDPIQGAYTYRDSLLFIHTNQYAYLLNPYTEHWQCYSVDPAGRNSFSC